MLTVASPPVSDVELTLRAESAERQIRKIRAAGSTPADASRFTLLIGSPQNVAAGVVQSSPDLFIASRSESSASGFATK
jgi:hypothetical protein